MQGSPNGGSPRNALLTLLRLSRQQPWLAWFLIWILLFVFYLMSAPGNRIEADDAFWFACEVDRGGLRDQLLGHNSHLLYLPLMSGIHQGLERLGIALSAYDLLRLVSNLSAPSAALAFFAIARDRFGMSLDSALACTAGLCVSYGFWRYANEAEVYSLAATLTLFALWMAFGATSQVRVLAVAGLAVAGSFINILGVIPALVVIPFVIARGDNARRVGLYVGTYLALFLSVTYGAFAYAGVDQSYLAFMRPPQTGISFRTGAAESVVGFGPSLVAGNFLLTYAPVLDSIETHFPSRVLEEERFLAGRVSLELKVAPLFTGAALGALLALLVQSLRRRRMTARFPSKSYLLPILAWIVGHWFVVVRVDPGAPEAWIPMLLPVWFAVGISVFNRARSASQRRMIWLVVVALTLHNYVGGLLLMRDASKDYNARRAAWLVSHAGRDDVILTIAGPVSTRYLAYHSTARVISLWNVSPRAVRSHYSMALSTPGNVYVMEEVFRPPEEIPQLDPDLFARVRELADDLRDRVRSVSSDASIGHVYVLAREGTGDVGGGDLPRTDSC